MDGEIKQLDQNPPSYLFRRGKALLRCAEAFHQPPKPSHYPLLALSLERGGWDRGRASRMSSPPKVVVWWLSQLVSDLGNKIDIK